MKTLVESLDVYIESLLDDDSVFYDHENDKKVIEEWIKDNYNIVGDLTSLRGGPEKVNGIFYCFGCKNLKITDSDCKKYKMVR